MDWINAVLLVGFAAMFLVAAALYRASQENDDLLRDKLREIERDVAESAANPMRLARTLYVPGSTWIV